MTNSQKRRLDLFGTASPVAFVSGSGAPRVGRAICEELADCGYRIVVHANRSVEQAKQYCSDLDRRGVENLLVCGAVQDEECVQEWKDTILTRFGRLDAVVCSAAIWNPKSLSETVAQDLTDHFQSNVVGSFLCGKILGLQMATQPTGGAVIFFGDWAIRRPYRKFAGYFPSKGAVHTLMRSMAVELADINPKMRVNEIQPGPVLLADESTEQTREEVRQACLLNREGTANDVARAALFLIEHPFLTGVSLPVDGGRSIFAASDNDAIAHPDVG